MGDVQQPRETEVVRERGWEYGDGVLAHVWIVRQNWDYFYEEEFDDEPPDLGPDGHAFYVLSGLGRHLDEHRSRSQTLTSLEEAVDYAEKTLRHVSWK